MEEKQPQTITIDDKEYNLADLSDKAKTIINHIRSLDNKIVNAQFNLDQLNVGRKAFGEMLTEELNEE